MKSPGTNPITSKELSQPYRQNSLNGIMQPEQGATIHECEIATLWFDDDGILHSVSKPGLRTMEVMIRYVNFMKKMLNNQHVCILTDISKAPPMDKVTRAYSEAELKNLYKAMAIVSTSALGRMIGNIFLKLNSLPLPTKMFVNEQEAKEWLKGYL
jgi:hypothetical protein